MAETPVYTPAAAALTEEAFYADRRRIYGTFTGMSVGATIAVVVLLVLMAFFLL